MSGSAVRYVDVLLVALIVVLTLSTAYIHYWVGGTMLLLNALGYLGLVVLTIGSFLFVRRAFPIVLLMLAAYAAVTILGWLVMGPYFDVAYLAKGIEIVLIGTIALYLLRNREDLRAAIAWARVLVARVLGRQAPEAASGPGTDQQ